MAEEYSRLKSQRNAIKGRITRIFNFTLEKKEGCDINEYVTRNADLETLMEKYDELQSLIEMKDDEDKDDDGEQSIRNEEDRNAVETKYYTTRAALQKVIDANKTHLTISNNFSARPYDRHIKNDVPLPKLELPTFDGKITEWPSFKNIFMTTVGSSNMSPSRKLQFLKTALKGEAAGLVSALLISDDNFIKAMETLSTRYENKALVVNTHLKSFLNHATVNRNNLKDFLNSLQQSLDSLNALDVNTNGWDVLLVFLITQKLDNSLRASWELSKKENNLPMLKELQEFLNLRMTAFEVINDKTGDSKPQISSRYKVSCNASIINRENVCVMCKGKHLLYKCPEFIQLTPVQRNDYAKSNTICFNCLKPYKLNHKCSKYKCLTCRGRHHTMLHMQRSPILNKPLVPRVANNTHAQDVLLTNEGITAPTLSATTTTEPTVLVNNRSDYSYDKLISDDHLKVDNKHVVHTAHMNNNFNMHVLLSTAIIRFQDAAGQWHSARALLDSGSEVNLITSRLALKLKCRQHSNQYSILGVGATQQHSNVCITTNIASRKNEFTASITCLVIDTITVPLPHFYVCTDSWRIPKQQARTLADPTFSVPGEIDILLGAQLFYSFITEGHITLGTNLPHLINTVFGWIISGTLVVDTLAVKNVTTALSSTVVSLHLSYDKCDKILSRFWEQEELINKPALTPAGLKRPLQQNHIRIII